MTASSDATRPLPASPTRVIELCVNLDDLPGQLMADACEALLNEGALDVWTTPIGMKKGRPGVMLSVLAPEGEQPRFARRLIELTGSFGVRFRAWDRVVLDREHVMIRTTLGTLRLKVGRLDGGVLIARPEHEDVRELARKAGCDVREAQRLADADASRWLDEQRKGSS